MYDNVEDVTSRTGGLAKHKRSGSDISNIVLHRTGADTGDSTLSLYDDRIQGKLGSKQQHTGAHYLIDENGKIKLTVPTDAVVEHAGGLNTSGVGIEMTGKYETIDIPKDDANKKNLDEMRAKVQALNLSPKFKKRLMGYSPPQLRQVLQNSGDGGQIYQDINAEQKRSSWLLVNRLASEYGLDLNSTSTAGLGEQPDRANESQAVVAHEHHNPKTLGEGENALEFIQTMQSFMQKGGLVDQAEDRLKELRRQNSKDPAVQVKIVEMEALVAKERQTQEAIKLDGNPDEKILYEKEQREHKPGGPPGPATVRENLRKQFYEGFYDRIEQLKPEDHKKTAQEIEKAAQGIASRPAEARPAESGPAEPNSTESRPTESTPAESRPGTAYPPRRSPLIPSLTPTSRTRSRAPEANNKGKLRSS